jgi:hypothetical protein
MSGEIDRMAAMLAESWAQRSPGEQSSFVNRLTADAGQPIAESVRMVRQRGALSGAVAPRDLVRGISRVDADRLLDDVLVDFDRTLVDGNWTWTLRHGPRREVLARLAATGTLHEALTDAARIGTDAAGEVLRELARTGEQRAEHHDLAPEKQHRVVLQALTWAEPLGGHAGDLAEARRQAAVAAIRDSYETLLRRGFHGRAKELAALRRFAEARVRPERPVPFLTVTGVGGSGKSTLIAALIRPYLERLAAGDPTAPAVVVIDFDRVPFRVNAELELSFELTRQLGCAAPVASADFSVLRHQTREERKYTGDDVAQGHTNFESSIRTSTGFEHEAGVLVHMHELERRPVVLILDTFEEWQRDRPFSFADRNSWNDPEQRIMDWIGQLRDEMGLRGLRVIASGRAEVSATDGVEATRTVRVGDLDRGSAIKLLGAAGVSGKPAGELVGAVGANPLTLRVAARFYRRLSKAERRRFVTEPHRRNPKLDHELRRAVLYDRFLDHIRDQRVRVLAHPGLALRRVTPDLVREVLASHCRLDGIGEEEAHELTTKLADEVWLVRSTPDGLRHQPDVRRVMLRMMSDDPNHGETVRAIHRAAADWYQADCDPALSREAAQMEWLYHTLMLERGDRSIAELLGHARAGQLAVTLGTDLADLHPDVQNQVRALRGDTLSEDEARRLPDDLWTPWIERHGAGLVNESKSRRALRFVTERLGRDREISEPAWLAQAYCDAAQWSDYWTWVRRGYLLDEGDRSHLLGSGRYAFINALGSEDPQAFERYDHHLTEVHRSWRRSRDVDPAHASERLFLSLLRGMPMSPGDAYWSVRAGKVPPNTDLYPVDQLRRLVVGLELSPHREQFAMTQTAGLFRPDPGWITAWTRFTRTSDKRNFGEELLTRRMRSDEVLGEWSSRFARHWPRTKLPSGGPPRTQDLMRVLRGDNPELRPAVRMAVSTLAEQHGLEELAAIAAGLLPVPVTDLHPDAVQHVAFTQSEKLIVQLVEYVDRSGVMRAFLGALRDTYPGTELIGRVTGVFLAWDDAYNQLLRSLVSCDSVGARRPDSGSYFLRRMTLRTSIAVVTRRTVTAK